MEKICHCKIRDIGVIKIIFLPFFGTVVCKKCNSKFRQNRLWGIIYLMQVIVIILLVIYADFASYFSSFIYLFFYVVLFYFFKIVIPLKEIK